MEYKEFTIKADGVNAEKGTLSGYASVFDVVDNGGDIIRKGAFKSALQGNRVLPLLWQHNSSIPIGAIKELKEDDKGLFFEGKISINTTQGRDAFELLKDGAVSGVSIGYIAKQSEFDRNNDVRIINEIDLFEISLVTFPMNDDARIESVKGKPKTERELEKCLRDAGYSKNESKTIISGGFKALKGRRDASVNGGNSDAIAEILNYLKTEVSNVRGHNKTGSGGD
jgi:HK97 family phage prohead protease